MNDKSSKTRGNKLGFFLFRLIIKYIGINSAYILLPLVCLYYVIFDKKAGESALPYIKRRFPDSSKIKLLYHVFRLFINQGKQLIDRYIYLNKQDFFEFDLKENVDIYNILKLKNKGFIVLTSHIGNWQIGLGALKYMESKKLNIVMNYETNPEAKKTFKFHDTLSKVNVISPLQDFGGILEITKALQNNEIVTIMGDRAYGAKTFNINFLGNNAAFPITAFQLAVSIECPIIFLYVIKNSTRKYTVHMTKVIKPEDENIKSKKQKIEKWLTEYVNELENFINKHPYQCFLFTDIWNSDN